MFSLSVYYFVITLQWSILFMFAHSDNLESTIDSLGILKQGELCKKNTYSTYRICDNTKVVLIILPTITRPSMIGSDKRVYHIIESLLALNNDVFLVEYGPSKKKANVDDKLLLKKLNYLLVKPFLRSAKNLNNHYIDLIRRIKPQIVIMWLWFWDFKNVIPELLIEGTKQGLPFAKTILFTDDVHSKREQQIAEQYQGHNKYNYFKRKSKRMQEIELKCYKAFDLVVTITNSDRKDIINMDPSLEPKLRHVNFVFSSWDKPMFQSSGAVQSDYNSFHLKSWDERSGLVFVGNGENPTNIHAINWYLKEIAVLLIKDFPGLVLNIIGPGWDSFQSQNSGDLRLVFKGSMATDEMGAFIDSCKVFVSPIIASTGINTKNVLALSRGIPLVTTPAGAIGMCESCDTSTMSSPVDIFDTSQKKQDDYPLLIGMDVYDFSEKVKRLLSDKSLWKEYSEKGISHNEIWFSKYKAAKQLDESLYSLYNSNSIDSNSNNV